MRILLIGMASYECWYMANKDDPIRQFLQSIWKGSKYWQVGSQTILTGVLSCRVCVFGLEVSSLYMFSLMHFSVFPQSLLLSHPFHPLFSSPFSPFLLLSYLLFPPRNPPLLFFFFIFSFFSHALILLLLLFPFSSPSPPLHFFSTHFSSAPFIFPIPLPHSSSPFHLLFPGHFFWPLAPHSTGCQDGQFDSRLLSVLYQGILVHL